MVIQLNDKLDCGKICKLIQKMLTSHGDITNKAIAINIVEVIENLQKIEYKKQDE